VLPGTSFIVGLDTATRILDRKYYPGADGLEVMLQMLAQQHVRFVVAGRVADPSAGVGQFLTLDADLLVPPGHESTFIGLTEEEFRLDVSSSMLRRAQSPPTTPPTPPTPPTSQSMPFADAQRMLRKDNIPKPSL
jgi:hypothetical protein